MDRHLNVKFISVCRPSSVAFLVLAPSVASCFRLPFIISRCLPLSFCRLREQGSACSFNTMRLPSVYVCLMLRLWTLSVARTVLRRVEWWNSKRAAEENSVLG